MKIYPYVDKSRANRDGSFPVYFIVSTRQGRFFVNTGITTCDKLVEMTFPRADGNWKQKTVLMGKYLADIESLCLSVDIAGLSNAELKERIQQDVFGFAKKKAKAFGLPDAVRQSSATKREHTAVLYGITEKKVERYLSGRTAKHCSLDDVDAEWLLRGTGDMLLANEPSGISDSKFKQFQDKVVSMSSNKEQMNMAYDIAMSALDLVGKTYEFLGKKGM